MAVFFRDLGHGKVKVSFRSTGEVDVNAVRAAVRRRRTREGSGRAHRGDAGDVRDSVIEAARAFLRPR